MAVKVLRDHSSLQRPGEPAGASRRRQRPGLYTAGFAPTMMNPCPGVLVPLNREPDSFFAGWLTAALWA